MVLSDSIAESGIRTLFTIVSAMPQRESLPTTAHRQDPNYFYGSLPTNHKVVVVCQVLTCLKKKWYLPRVQLSPVCTSIRPRQWLKLSYQPKPLRLAFNCRPQCVENTVSRHNMTPTSVHPFSVCLQRRSEGWAWGLKPALTRR
jgi:hypothetical protein